MKRALLRSSAFARDLKKWLKLHPETADAIARTLEKMAEDVQAPSLRTHKLSGPLAGCWACSSGYDLRIVFEFVQHEEAEAILLLALGTHDQVY